MVNFAPYFYIYCYDRMICVRIVDEEHSPYDDMILVIKESTQIQKFTLLRNAKVRQLCKQSQRNSVKIIVVNTIF